MICLAPFKALPHVPIPRYDPIVQWPRTLPFHGGDTGSNPVRVAIIISDLRKSG